jgi:hypothetical protein
MPPPKTGDVLFQRARDCDFGEGAHDRVTPALVCRSSSLSSIWRRLQTLIEAGASHVASTLLETRQYLAEAAQAEALSTDPNAA